MKWLVFLLSFSFMACALAPNSQQHARKAHEMLSTAHASTKSPALYALSAEAYHLAEEALEQGESQRADGFFLASIRFAQAALWKLERGEVEAHRKEIRSDINTTKDSASEQWWDRFSTAP